MKVNGGIFLSKPEPKTKIRRSPQNSTCSGVDFLSLSDNMIETSSTPALSSPQKIDVILSIQEIDPELEKNKKVTYKSDQMLKGLENLQLQLLHGNLSYERLLELKKLYEMPSVPSKDVKLISLQKQIEQRLCIELSKYEMA